MQLSLMPTRTLAELASSADRQGLEYVQILTKNQLGLGADPLNPTHVIDLTKESIQPISGSDAPTDPTTPVVQVPRRVSRRSGEYYIEIEGRKTSCWSLKEILSTGLRTLEYSHPGTLEQLSSIKRRTKRIVSRDREELFTKPKLVQNYSEELSDGWWFGTNNSADETLTWLRRAADIAGLKWGTDIKTNFG